jgi:hypothetical protein
VAHPLLATVPRMGRPRKVTESSTSTRLQRARQNGIGRTKQQELDYLAAHAPDLLTAVQAGAMSVHRAYGVCASDEPA